MALKAVAHCGRMNRPLQIGRILVSMTSDEQRLRRGCDQFDASDIFIDSDFVSAGATGSDCMVNYLALRFVFMTRDALCGIGVFFQRDRMDGRV